MKSPFFLLFLFGACLFAPQIQAQGALLDEEAYGKIRTVPEGVRSPGDKQLLTKFCPTPTDQGNIHSCVGHAIAHAVTIRRSYQCDILDPDKINEMVHSASFIYNPNKLDEDCESGAYFKTCFEFASAKGVCLERSFPNSPYKCVPLPTSHHFIEAAQFKIKRYEKLFEINVSASAKYNTTMIYLDWNNPIIIGLPIPKNFREQSSFQKEDWASVSENSDNLHAMVVVDYNEEEREFLLLNSYGADWGKGGFVRIGFEDFGRLVRSGFLISLGKVDCE